jgi:hypothetical protein
MDLREKGWVGKVWNDLAQDGSCEHDNEPSVSINCTTGGFSRRLCEWCRLSRPVASAAGGRGEGDNVSTRWGRCFHTD